MQRLQKTSTAWIVTLVVILLAVCIGASNSLHRDYAKTTELFYLEDQRIGEGIYTDLMRIKENSYNLVTVAERYVGEDDLFVQEVRQCAVDLDSAYTGRMWYAAAEKLRAAVNELDMQLRSQPLTDTDKAYHNKLVVNIQSAYSTIDSTAYNTAAKKFNDDIAAFPANVLSGIVGVGPVALYE